MNIPANNFENHFANNLTFHSIYLITGEEIFFIEECTRLIRQKAREQQYDEQIIIETDGNLTQAFELFLTHTQNFSLFSTKKLIELRFYQKIPAVFFDTLIKNGQSPNRDQILLIRTPKLSKAETTQKWYQAIDQHGCIINAWPIKDEAFLRWIKTRLDKFNLTTSQEGYNLIAENTEGNLLAAAQTIEKLHWIYGNRNTSHGENTPVHLNKDDLQTVLTEHSHYDIFELCDAVLKQNPKHCLKILSALRSQGAEPAVILWALTQDLRKLFVLSQTPSSQRSSLYQKLGIWSARQTAFQKTLAALRPDTLPYLIQQAKHIDSFIKGVSPGNIWEALENFCFKLSAPHT